MSGTLIAAKEKLFQGFIKANAFSKIFKMENN